MSDNPLTPITIEKMEMTGMSTHRINVAKLYGLVGKTVRKISGHGDINLPQLYASLLLIAGQSPTINVTENSYTIGKIDVMFKEEDGEIVTYHNGEPEMAYEKDTDGNVSVAKYLKVGDEEHYTYTDGLMTSLIVKSEGFIKIDFTYDDSDYMVKEYVFEDNKLALIIEHSVVEQSNSRLELSSLINQDPLGETHQPHTKSSLVLHFE